MSEELDKSFEAKKELNVLEVQIFRKDENQKIYMGRNSPGGNSPGGNYRLGIHQVGILQTLFI